MQEFLKLEGMGLLLKLAPVDVFVNLLFGRVVIPLIQDVPAINRLFVCQVRVLISAFELVVRHVWMIINIVIIVVNIFPRQLTM